MWGVLKFAFWSQANNLIFWFFGMLVRVIFWLVVIGVALVVLNPANPAYDAKARKTFEAEAAQIEKTGELTDTWKKFLKSASTECHFKPATPQEWMLSGNLPDELIIPNSNEIKWILRVPVNMSQNLWSTGPVFTPGIVSLQTFYGIINGQGFRPCNTSDATKARAALGI